MKEIWVGKKLEVTGYSAITLAEHKGKIFNFSLCQTEFKSSGSSIGGAAFSYKGKRLKSGGGEK
jgi:hypothetical protein